MPGWRRAPLEYLARVPAPPDPHPPVSPRRLRFVLALCAGATLTAFVLAVIPPASRPVLPPDAATRGEAFEQALASAITKVRPAGESWAIAIDPADINAWLATRLPQWIDHDPALADFAAATSVRLAADDGALLVEAPVGPSRLGLIATVRMPLELTDSVAHRLRLDIGATRIGLLPIPVGGPGLPVADALASELARLEQRYPDRRFRLGDGRTIEIRAISCESGQIRIRFATHPASTAPAAAPTR